MVWFQCEDCGENLKKPKLPNHFRICSAFKLSCIDCGETFGQQSVQGHNQCITEAEKYGPKGQVKASSKTPAKPTSDSKPKPDFDVNVGLSSRPPWFCSLCNASATSKQTLLLHAEGKKHRAKARAFHNSKQQTKPTEESAPSLKESTCDPTKEDLLTGIDVEPQKVQDPRKDGVVLSCSDGSLSSKRKKTLDESESGNARGKHGTDTPGDSNNGEVIQAKIPGAEPECQVKKRKASVLPKEDKVENMGDSNKEAKKKIKWKKLITSALKSNSDGTLKIKKLQKLVFKALRESGATEDEEAELKDMLLHKINSSSRFMLQDKLVHLVAKS
ncbi:UBP1-associated proteins 1C [Macadamia integrifolia]|uniref:UBP1-associated proteins 1C n=1 Tax=Macadamia integrifolia TaxID=60698 RepID=UPI001C4F2126|nr:UBP1-associated proteins 1C [Macadamia integrifolia]